MNNKATSTSMNHFRNDAHRLLYPRKGEQNRQMPTHTTQHNLYHLIKLQIIEWLSAELNFFMTNNAN